MAFGDGLAFGVGMKLTQNAARQPGLPHSGGTALADRLDRLELRFERLEHTAIAAPGAVPAPEPAGFARKVIETVVQAVDERLNEHARQMEQRWAKFEGRVAELRSQFDAGIVAVHNRVEGQIQGLVKSEEQLRQEIQRVADRASTFDASAAEAVIEMKLVPLRLEIAEMRLRLAESDRSVAEMAAVHNRVEGEIQGLVNSEDQLRQQVQRVADRLSSFDPLRTEIAEMRQRLAESDRSVLDLILAIGRMCRQAAERITDPAPLPAETAPPPSLTEPPPIATGDSLAPAPEEPQAPMDPPLDSSAPDFTQLKKATSLWRVPLVSSFLLATGSLLMLHYL